MLILNFPSSSPFHQQKLLIGSQITSGISAFSFKPNPQISEANYSLLHIRHIMPVEVTTLVAYFSKTILTTLRN